MKKILFSLATIVAAALAANDLRAATTLAYSYEDPSINGFFGLGATVSQDTIGATDGTHSLKYAVGGGGFVGARTETDIPAALNNPPGVNYVLFDLFVPDTYSDTFADIGINVFGHDIPAGNFGLNVQFGQDGSPGSLYHVAGLAPGEYLDQRINLTGGVNPETFVGGQTFNQIFGPGPNQLTVSSAFQFFISKNGATPITVYIDNVRLVGVPEPASCTLLGLGAIGLAAVGRRRFR